VVEVENPLERPAGLSFSGPQGDLALHGRAAHEHGQKHIQGCPLQKGKPQAREVIGLHVYTHDVKAGIKQQPRKTGPRKI